MIINEQSKLVGVDHAKKILEKINQGQNVVILSNHQTEADPQVISVLLEQNGLAELAEKMIFIAGHKVTNDPICIPFSMGRNLICIHSKKHIKNPPEDMQRKQAQNLESMKVSFVLYNLTCSCVLYFGYHVDFHVITSSSLFLFIHCITIHHAHC